MERLAYIVGPSRVNIQNDRLTVGAAGVTLFTAILWGGNSVAIKVALGGMPPLTVAGFRFLLGGAFITLWCLLSSTRLWLKPGETRQISSLLLLFVAQIGLLNLGTDYTLASRSTIFISTYPFFTALFAHLFIRGDQLHRGKVVGMTLSFSGVVVVFGESLLEGKWQYLVGDIIVIGSALLLGARQVYTKRLAQNIDPARLLLWQSAFSLPIFFGASLWVEDLERVELTSRVLTGIFYQGVVIAGFCFLVMTHLLKRYRASQIGVYGFVTPIFGVLLSGLVLNEPISPGLIGSMILVGAGIALSNARR